MISNLSTSIAYQKYQMLSIQLSCRKQCNDFCYKGPVRCWLSVSSGANPYIVVNYDSVNKAGSDYGYNDMRDAAAAWVAYAKSKGYNVRHWEFSNESLHYCESPSRLYSCVCLFLPMCTPLHLACNPLAYSDSLV